MSLLRPASLVSAVCLLMGVPAAVAAPAPVVSPVVSPGAATRHAIGAGVAGVGQGVRSAGVMPWAPAVSPVPEAFASRPADRSASTFTSPTAPTEVPAAASSAVASSAVASAGVSNVPPVPRGWVETPISFRTSLGIFYGTYTHPARGHRRVPATLIIGGSGPSDREGNSGAAMPSANTLKTLARWLAADGQATLRYDKLGSGQTGLAGHTPDELARVTFADYLTVNAQALVALSRQPGVNPHRLSVLGHSEGGLFAMLLAQGRTGDATGVPVVHRVASLEGLSTRVLDLLTVQLYAPVQQALAAGQISAQEAAQVHDSLARAVDAIRADQPVPSDLHPYVAAQMPYLLPAATFLRTEDAVDPADVAAGLRHHTRLLLTCSDADIQVTCGDVRRVQDAARGSGVHVVAVTQHGIDHVLKVDDSHTGLHYNDDLPFSPRLHHAIDTWAR